MRTQNQRAAYVKHNSGGPAVLLENVTICKETAKAILATVEGEDHWFPLSQVLKILRTPNKDADAITVSYWIAKQKGLA